ncbi:ABC transporter permease [Microbulbifer sp. DLAB2-AF]|uniref:ABC transporter permease n=1 Tax=Microbulbifer sp. DLAB2-AF TaxID=3243395 RepID=UPI00403A3C82
MLILLVWQLFRQRYHQGDARLIRWTQASLMFFILTLSLTSSSIQAYLANNLQQMLGSDLVISQHQALTDAQLNKLHQHAQQLSVSQLVNVTLTHDHHWQAVQLKAVDDHYPVQGTVQVAFETDGQGQSLSHGPKSGEIWVDNRLFASLQLTLGQPLDMGHGQLKLTGLVQHEPDRLLEGHSVAMRALVHLDDLSLIQANNAHFRYLLTGDKSELNTLKQWATTELVTAQLYDKNSGHPLAMFWQRVENFVGLASVLLFLMAAIAIDQAGRRQLLSQQRFVAVCLAMGSDKPRVFALSFGQWLLTVIAGLIPATALAWGAEYLILQQMQTQFADLTTTWVWTDFLSSYALLLALLAIFQIPNWLVMAKVTPAQLIRQMSSPNHLLPRYGFALISVAAVAFVYSDNGLLTAMTLSAMAATLILMMVLTWLVLSLGHTVSSHAMGMIAFGFYMMKQRLLSKSIQILGIGMCATLLLFTLSLMKDIGQTMEGYTREHDGNLIITQANEQQVQDIRQWSAQTGSGIRQLKPFWYGQLSHINGQTLAEFATSPSESLASLQKPVRLHFSIQQATNNQTVTGQRWQDRDADWQQVSVEQEVMTDMGLKLGDQLQFEVAGQSLNFEIKASHKYVPGKGSITFWFNVPQSTKNQLQTPPLYMGSLELADTAWGQLAELWQRHPSLRLISVRELTQRFDDTLSMVIKLVSGFSLMIILLALLVISASVKGYEADERKKNALLISFGQSRLACCKLSLFEWLLTSLIASVGAILGTNLTAQLIYQSQFGINYKPDWLWIMATLLVSALVVCSAGMITNRSSLKFSVGALLRNGG